MTWYLSLKPNFDSVWRVGMWQKLLKYVNGNFFQLVKSMYHNIKSCVQSVNPQDPHISLTIFPVILERDKEKTYPQFYFHYF